MLDVTSHYPTSNDVEKNEVWHSRYIVAGGSDSAGSSDCRSNIRAGDRAKVRVDIQCMNNVRHGEFLEITVPYRGRDGTEYGPLWFRGRFAPPGRWELETG